MKNNFLKKVFTISSFLLLGAVTSCVYNFNEKPTPCSERSEDPGVAIRKNNARFKPNDTSKKIYYQQEELTFTESLFKINLENSSIDYFSLNIDLVIVYDFSSSSFTYVYLKETIVSNAQPTTSNIDLTYFIDDAFLSSEKSCVVGYFNTIGSNYFNLSDGEYEFEYEKYDGSYDFNYVYSSDSTNYFLGSTISNGTEFVFTYDFEDFYETYNSMEYLLDSYYNDGYYVGNNDGYYNGFDDGEEEGYNNGLSDGYSNGYNQALNDGAKDTGIFKYGNIILGLYDFEEEEFSSDYSYEGNIYEGLVDPIDGGFKMNSHIYDFEDIFTDGTGSRDYSVGYMVDFGEFGVDISNVEYLFPLQGSGSSYIPRLDYGVQYVFTFENGEIMYSGADDGALSSFNVKRDLGNMGRLKSILATGNNFDYVPYGITQNLSYSFGYDAGYSNGKSEGFESGYDVGYLNGTTATNSQKYTEGYNKGYLDGVNSIEVNGITFESLAHAIVTAPSTMIKNAFDFDILGVNVGGLVNTALVIALVVFAIGLFKKG